MVDRGRFFVHPRQCPLQPAALLVHLPVQGVLIDCPWAATAGAQVGQSLPQLPCPLADLGRVDLRLRRQLLHALALLHRGPREHRRALGPGLSTLPRHGVSPLLTEGFLVPELTYALGQFSGTIIGSPEVSILAKIKFRDFEECLCPHGWNWTYCESLGQRLISLREATPDASSAYDWLQELRKAQIDPDTARLGEDICAPGTRGQSSPSQHSAPPNGRPTKMVERTLLETVVPCLKHAGWTDTRSCEFLQVLLIHSFGYTTERAANLPTTSTGKGTILAPRNPLPNSPSLLTPVRQPTGKNPSI